MEEQQEFARWYNEERKQSDTGKTPKEMGERMLNFGLDEDDEYMTRPCPECLSFAGLEIAEDLNKYECVVCGSVWQRLKSINDGTGNMINMPEKLKKLLDESEKKSSKTIEINL